MDGKMTDEMNSKFLSQSLSLFAVGSAGLLNSFGARLERCV